MSVEAACKAIQKEHGLARAPALRLARATVATMPGDPPTKAIVAEARHLMRRVSQGKRIHPLGSGLRFQHQSDAILRTFRDRGEEYEGKEARARANAMTARQMRDAYGDDYVQFLSALGRQAARGGS